MPERVLLLLSITRAGSLALDSWVPFKSHRDSHIVSHSDTLQQLDSLEIVTFSLDDFDSHVHRLLDVLSLRSLWHSDSDNLQELDSFGYSHIQVGKFWFPTFTLSLIHI